jgi:hypothetical protein
LIKDHNIESENIFKLKTKNNVSKEGPPPQVYYY